VAIHLVLRCILSSLDLLWGRGQDGGAGLSGA
jgi:hypothetical protein